MIVTLGPDADPTLVRHALIDRGLWVRRFDGNHAVQFLVEPPSPPIAPGEILAIHGVVDVAVTRPATPLLDAHPPRVSVRGVDVGVGARPILIAGPCSIETEDRTHRLAAEVARSGAAFLRGGAFKPRTSPYDFRGHGECALRWMRSAADLNGLRVVTEVLQPAEVSLVAEYADVLQIGARNMHNAPLLRAAGAANLPVVLKRGMAATIDEWLFAAEGLLLHGASGVILCERGIRGFEPATRFTLDVAAVALIAEVHQLPVIVDPSHGAGRRDLIPALCRAGLAAGAAGIMIEVHDDPGAALSDGPQAVAPSTLRAIANEMGIRRHLSGDSNLRSRVA